MRLTICAISVLALTMTHGVAAEDDAPYSSDPGPHAGNWEATLSGSGLSDDNFDAPGFGVTGSLGYYQTDNLLYTMKQGLQINDSGDSTVVSARTVFQGAYQWDLDKWQPYVGMNVGAIYGAGINDEAIFGPEVGVKYYVNESTFLYGNMAYEVPVDECCNDGVVPYAVGVGFNF